MFEKLTIGTFVNMQQRVVSQLLNEMDGIEPLKQVCAYVYVCVYVYMYVCMCVFIHVCVCMHIYE